MLSPYKLYKHDKSKLGNRIAVTWGPEGKPSKGSSGTLCYRSGKCDWALHRLAPAIVDRDIKSKRKVGLKKPIAAVTGKVMGAGAYGKRSPRRALMVTSPRWGPGVAPGRNYVRKTVPLPKVGTVEISKKTYAAAGAVAVAGAGYYGYTHRKELKKRVDHIQEKFHGGRRTAHGR